MLGERHWSSIVLEVKGLGSLLGIFLWSFFALRSWDETSEDKDLRACNLGCACQKHPQSLRLRDVVDGLPRLLLKFVHFNLLHKVEWLRSTNPRLWLEALAAKHENVPLVEVACGALLPREGEGLQRSPLVVSDRVNLKVAQAFQLALAILGMSHPAQAVDLVRVNHHQGMIGPSRVHVLQCDILRSMLIQHKRIPREMVDRWEVPADLVAGPVG